MMQGAGTEYRVDSVDPYERELVADIYACAWAGEPEPPIDIRSRCDWLYLANPAGPAKILALIAPNGIPVGMLAVVPRRFWVNGNPCTLGMLCDFVVHRAHRTVMPAIKLQRAARGLAGSLGWGTYAIPNEKSLPVIRRLGDQTVVQRPRLARPIRHYEYVARRSTLLAALASRPLDAVAWIWDCAMSLPTGGLRAEWLSSFQDPRIDELWQRLRPSACSGERTAEFLNWRFGQEPSRQNQMLGILHKDTGALVAYAIGDRQGDTFEVRDFLHDPDSRGVRVSIGLTMRKIRNLGVANVSFRLHAESALTTAFATLGFRPREFETIFFHGECDRQFGSALVTRADEDV